MMLMMFLSFRKLLGIRTISVPARDLQKSQMDKWHCQIQRFVTLNHWILGESTNFDHHFLDLQIFGVLTNQTIRSHLPSPTIPNHRSSGPPHVRQQKNEPDPKRPWCWAIRWFPQWPDISFRLARGSVCRSLPSNTTDCKYQIVLFCGWHANTNFSAGPNATLKIPSFGSVLIIWLPCGDSCMSLQKLLWKNRYG